MWLGAEMPDDCPYATGWSRCDAMEDMSLGSCQCEEFHIEFLSH